MVDDDAHRQSEIGGPADRNPQKFMNIFKADPSDYQKHKVYHQKSAASCLKIHVLEK